MLLGALGRAAKNRRKKTPQLSEAGETTESWAPEQHGHQMWELLSNSALKDQVFSLSAGI